jgi:hypothetical protein
MSEPIDVNIIKEMLTADVSSDRKDTFPISLSQAMELYDIDEQEGCWILKKDITDEMFRYINLNPYNLLNYALVNQKFMDKYMCYFHALKETRNWCLIDFKKKYPSLIDDIKN